ncbi:MAG: class I SAM-dependent methyltransferase [Methylobacter sp.]|nr:class I SAM-dependent methyltransferase [Candidatus Methylobacter titanis]
MTENDNIHARQIEKYNAAAGRHGLSSKSVLWDDPQTQYLRFYEIAKHLDLNGSKTTLLDLGCGNGEFYKFLNFLGFRGGYTGYDINEVLLAQARKRFRNITVQNADIMGEEIDQCFDYVILSGLFNVNVGQTPDWVHAFLKKMYALSGEVMVFNMISTHVTYRDEGMFYMDPAEVLSFCIENLSRRTTLVHHNLPYNYTVAVFKDESWDSIRESAA